jgi:hypothetical protein
MNRSLFLAAAAAVAAAMPHHAHAHAIAGDRTFPVTLTIDDPGVADEASIPTYTWNPQQKGQPTIRINDLGFEYDKRITDAFALSVNGDYDIVKQNGDKTLTGWDNFVLTAKYRVYVSAEHEFIASIGVVQELGGTGAYNIADTDGTTTPTFYFGKGLGDLPADMGWARPLAVTGELQYQISDHQKRNSFSTDPITGLSITNTAHAPNFFLWGGSVQYSLPYMQAQVKDYGFPDWVNNLIPIVEFSFSTPATRGYGIGPQGIISPGIIYLSHTWQVGIEALIPVNKASGSNVGLIAQFHVFLDDIFPNSIGKPIFGGQ